MAVTAQIKYDALRLAALLAAQRLVDGSLDDVVGLRCRHNPLRARKLHPRFKALQLVVGARFDIAALQDVAD